MAGWVGGSKPNTLGCRRFCAPQSSQLTLINNLLTSRKLLALCQRVVVRFIVVDGQTDRVCGDVVYAEVTPDAASNADSLESLCKAAARTVDDRRGEQHGAYEFSCFEPPDKAPGYFVFLANEQCLCSSCEGCPASLSEVFTCSFYVGFVHRCPQ